MTNTKSTKMSQKTAAKGQKKAVEEESASLEEKEISCSEESELSSREDEEIGEIEFLLTEGSKFKQYLTASNLYSQTLYFYFEKEKMTIYFKDETEQEQKKGTKKGKKRDTRISGNCTFDIETIQYKNTFEKPLCLAVEIPVLTAQMKAVTVGVQLQFNILEKDLDYISVVPGFPGRLSLTSVMKIKSRPVEFAECKISTMSIPEPKITKVCQEKDLSIVLASITAVGKDIGNSSIRVSEKGYVIQTTTQNGTQVFSLQPDIDDEPIATIDINRSLVDVLKKMQIKKGTVRINYYPEGNYHLCFKRKEGPMSISVFI